MTDEIRDDGGELESPDGAVPAVDVTGAALGALAPDEASVVRAAAASDPSVAAELANMEEVVAELARLIPGRQMNRGRSAGIRSRLVSRAAGSGDGRTAAAQPGAEATKAAPKAPAPRPTGTFIDVGMTAPPARPLPPVYRRSFTWRDAVAIAAVIALVATGTLLMNVMRDRDHLRNAVAVQQASMARQMDDLKSVMATKDSLIGSLTGPQMKVVDMVAYAAQSPLARMYWDQKTQEWTMYAYHLRQPAPGKTFQVWLITRISDKPVSAGVFKPDANGTAVMHATYALERGMLRKVAISEEPAGGMPYPTGPIIIAGSGK